MVYLHSSLFGCEAMATWYADSWDGSPAPAKEKCGKRHNAAIAEVTQRSQRGHPRGFCMDVKRKELLEEGFVRY
jgi:hypothetical protein